MQLRAVSTCFDPPPQCIVEAQHARACPAELIGPLIRVGLGSSIVAFHNARLRGSSTTKRYRSGQAMLPLHFIKHKVRLSVAYAGILWAQGSKYNTQFRRLRRLVVCCHCNYAFTYMSQPYSSFFAAGAGLDVHAPFFFSSSPFSPSFFLFFLSL